MKLSLGLLLGGVYFFIEITLDVISINLKNRDVSIGKRIRRGKDVDLGTVTQAGLSCRARANLMAHIRPAAKDGATVRNKCAFCGKLRTRFFCKLCGAHLCLSAPVHINIANCDPPRKYRADGLFCYHLWHGYKRWSDLD